jgi:hypothetical protein
MVVWQAGTPGAAVAACAGGGVRACGRAAAVQVRGQRPGAGERQVPIEGTF